MVRFCLNSLVNFAKRFCYIFIRLGSGEGIGRGRRGGGASVPIKCVKIIENGRERNREKVTKTEKKSVNFDGNKHRLRTGTESTDKTLKKLP